MLGMLYFGLAGLLIAGSAITVLETVPVVAKEGTVSVYFSGIALNTRGDPNVLPQTVQGILSLRILSLNVTIASVSVHRAGADDESGWTEISSNLMVLDIMKSTDVTTLIAMGPVPQQNVTMVRLKVTGATAAVSGSSAGSPEPVVVSSGELRIPLGSARVRAQLNTSITVTGVMNIVVEGSGTIRLTPVLHVDRVTGPV